MARAVEGIGKHHHGGQEATRSQSATVFNRTCPKHTIREKDIIDSAPCCERPTKTRISGKLACSLEMLLPCLISRCRSIDVETRPVIIGTCVLWGRASNVPLAVSEAAGTLRTTA